MADPIKKVVLQDGAVRWRFVIDAGKTSTGKRRQMTVTKDTKTEARDEYARIRHENSRGTFIPKSKLTLNQALDDWLSSATRDVEAATAANYRDAIRPAKARLGDKQLQLVTEKDVEGLVDWMLTEGRVRGGKPGTGVSARTAKLTLGRLRSALDLAVRKNLVPRNVAQHVTRPRGRGQRTDAQKAKRTPWTEDEVVAFFDAIREDRLYPVMVLSLMGLRPAEVAGLRWSDVDLDAPTLEVANTRTLVDGVVEEKAPKTDAGERTLPLPKFVAEALRAFKAAQDAERDAAGTAYVGSGYVVVDELGQPVKTDWLRRRAYKLMAQADVRQVVPYANRHACLTLLSAPGSGVPAPVVSAWAGHADLSFTQRVYVHPDVTHLKAAAKRLDRILSRKPRKT